ncbi:LOW QUALITY PROTEIN: hemojuvelin [Menidia menidia]
MLRKADKTKKSSEKLRKISGKPKTYHIKVQESNSRIFLPGFGRLRMEPGASPWKPCIQLTLLPLLVHLRLPEAVASCRILQCNSDFVAASLDAGGGGYCSALRSYGVCTRRAARGCRGDLAYHSAVQGIEDLLMQHGCPRAGPTARPRPRAPRAPQPGGAACLYEHEHVHEYVHCSVFGDPHVRTFGGELQTCAVQGAWPLIDNEHLYVQATSTRAGGATPPPTVLTKVTIIFKSWRQCADQQLYQAEVGHVPAAFADGSARSVERQGLRSLSVRTRSPGRHAEIRAAHIGTLLVVRETGGRALALSVRAPLGVVRAHGPEQDLQLCVWGCPAAQRLRTRSPPPPHAMLRAQAEAHCGARLPARDPYFHACVFDLVASGDLNASQAAVCAREDAHSMTSGASGTRLLPHAAASHARAKRPRASGLLLLLMLLLLALDAACA